LARIRDDNSIEIKAKVFLDGAESSTKALSQLEKTWNTGNVTTILEVVTDAAKADFSIQSIDAVRMRDVLGWCECADAAMINGYMDIKDGRNIMYINNTSINPDKVTPGHEFGHFLFGYGHAIKGSGRVLSHDENQKVLPVDELDIRRSLNER